MATPITAPMLELRNPDTGRLDARRIAGYLAIPLSRLAPALGRKYGTLHKAPDAPAVQEQLAPIAHSIEMLLEVLDDRAAVLAWMNAPHPDLGGRTPLAVIEMGLTNAVEGMLQAALWGIPT
ncbi:MAG TPA: antitoxin Xre/MbcA/ParS toxin-binding domain-containing protein [Dehalococcoidia bacterium]|nr:antitoxin Xre/MbcA/ParS toxin-binding domain-containing protein [Dehalococcoidia bacterium]